MSFYNDVDWQAFLPPTDGPVPAFHIAHGSTHLAIGQITSVSLSVPRGTARIHVAGRYDFIQEYTLNILGAPINGGVDSFSAPSGFTGGIGPIFPRSDSGTDPDNMWNRARYFGNLVTGSLNFGGLGSQNASSAAGTFTMFFSLSDRGTHDGVLLDTHAALTIVCTMAPDVEDKYRDGCVVLQRENTYDPEDFLRSAATYEPEYTVRRVLNNGGGHSGSLMSHPWIDGPCIPSGSQGYTWGSGTVGVVGDETTAPFRPTYRLTVPDNLAATPGSLTGSLDIGPRAERQFVDAIETVEER